MTRSLGYGLACLAALAACAGTACVDVKSDYNQWIIRTNYTRGTGGVVEEEDASADGPDGSAPTGGFTQTYFMMCLSSLGSDSVTEATEFTSTAIYTPAADEAGGGTFNFTDTSLQANTTSWSQTVDTPTSETVPVTADGFAVVNFGATTLPGAANPLGGVEIDFSSLILTFKIGPGDNLCATITGNLTAPDILTLEPKTDYCIFVPQDPSQPLPTLMQSQAANNCPQPQ